MIKPSLFFVFIHFNTFFRLFQDEKAHGKKKHCPFVS